MRVLLAIIILFLTACENKTPKSTSVKTTGDTLLSMAVTGIPEMESIAQRNIIAEKYGVKFYAAGCVFGNQRKNIEKANDSIAKIVEKKHGVNWLINFRHQLDTTDKVRLLVYEKICSLNIHFDGELYYLVTPGIKQNEYFVIIYTLRNKKNKFLVLGNLIVDYKKKTVMRFPMSHYE